MMRGAPTLAGRARCFGRGGGSGNRRGLAAAVKEVPWCAPSRPSPARRLPPRNPGGSGGEVNELAPIERFGIVAAMSRNRVIGLNGGLPWKIPEDRRRFKDLTRNAVLVLGRRTLEEHPDLRHVSHASHVVVLSRTLREDELRPDQRGHTSSSSPPAPLLTLASSFEAALDAARRIVVEKKSLMKAEGKIDGGGGNDAPDRLDCWVVGGERVYHEALLHPSAEQLHLTVVEMEVDDSNRGGSTQIARFPARYRWDNKFRLVSTASKTDEESSLAYRTDVFRRLKGRR